MKLQTKTSIYFHSLALTVFIAGVIIFYFMLRAHFNTIIKKDLICQKKQIIEYTSKYGILPSSFFLNIEINKSNCPASEEHIISDTLIVDVSENKILCKILRFKLKHDTDCYQVGIIKPLENRNFFSRLMIAGISAVILAIMAGIFIVNRYSLSKAWSVFYDTIKKINSHEINKDLILKKSDIKEFNILNNVILSMTNKIKKDYTNLKEFIENTSHEIQTPLAIIRSKLELVLQTENLSKSQVKDILAAYEASNKLSKLNEALILLTKIDHKQFPKLEKVNFSELVINQLGLFEDIIQSKNVITKQFIDENIMVFMNKELAGILIQNLIKNAVKYVTPEGVIEIRLTSDFFSISNTGALLPFEPKKIFESFKKSNKDKSSIGLGLSIVKKICELYEFEINYEFIASMHTFMLKNIK